ncbi:RNB domain-containing ribonuclease [Actinotalea sp. Marseille-Q4924]|uniref:RNB domain-containing ribonuclease n=1 Tax=Actinotalea sp. Marseille-Q4924 TaxID=2866571 RepID=UPI001CE44A87|nr:RNB domain-containing ribonuclease [Actinotalea sp. Marseille-Q4924]
MPTRIRRSRDDRRLADLAAAGEIREDRRSAVVDGPQLEAILARIREELALPERFPPDVLAAAERSVADPALPTTDWTDIPFLTIDPPGSTDLDQALHLARRDGGFRVHYAIADVPAFVPHGSPVDAEARRRGQTLYSPDGRVPLHPPAISEGAASLLPDNTAPAFVWVLDLDAEGRTTTAQVERALVRSRTRYDYEQVQREVDDGTAPDVLRLLKEVGELRAALERERGGATLPLPDQEVVEHPDGYELRLRPPVPSEDWNAQISLMTGMAAAAMMLDGGVGILRTMPAPDARTVTRFRRQALALGVAWPEGTPYGEVLRGLDPADPRQLALLHESTVLFRGAAYTPFDDGVLPEVREQAAVGAPYAHVTAPLRRLVDRFGLVTCEALCRGTEVPAWVREALPTLPALMAASDRLAGALERAAVDAAEAALLAGRVGEELEGVVVDVDDDGAGALLQVVAPPVLARVTGAGLQPGATVRARLVEADPVQRVVRFELLP